MWDVHAAHDADISPYLFASDVLVTDHSSAGFEFMLLDRPIVVIDCPDLIEKARVAPDKVRLLRNASIVAPCDASAIVEAVERSLEAPTAASNARHTAAARMFFRPGSATARAVECIYTALELEAPALAASSSSSCSSSRTAQHV